MAQQSLIPVTAEDVGRSARRLLTASLDLRAAQSNTAEVKAAEKQAKEEFGKALGEWEKLRLMYGVRDDDTSGLSSPEQADRLRAEVDKLLGEDDD